MNLSQQHKQLIEEIIKQNPAYRGHEDLMERFCSEVYKKSYLLLDSVSNLDSLKNYLTKVADTSIINVIQSAPRQETKQIRLPEINQTEPQKSAALFEPDKNAKSSYDIIDSLPDFNNSAAIESIIPKKKPVPSVVSLKDSGISTSNAPSFSSLIDPLEFFPRKLPAETFAENMVKALKQVNSKNPGKKYMNIFVMRHLQNAGQSSIARRLKISQADLSKRYCEMVKLIQQELN